MKYKNLLPGVFLALLGIFASTPLLAQSTSGNLAGTVYDASGAVVPGASVIARNNSTGVENATTSTSSGQYSVTNLLVGNYSLLVSAGGFTRAELKDVNVTLNQTVTANVTLQITSSSTSVEVSESAAQIDTTSAQVQTSYESKQLQDMPVASTGGTGSGIINLALLNAGVSTSGTVGAGTGPSVGGQRPNNNSFTIEGIDINNKSVTGPVVQLPNDAVAEFSVLQNQFNPEFGHSSGGQFNQVVKSGTNQFHGMFYEYFQNKNMNAADNLNAVEGNPLHPRYDNNRFGGNFGGPIKRNKLFFFANYEFEPYGTTASTFYDAPTQAGYSTLASIPGISSTNLSTFQKYLGTAPAATAPATLPFGQGVTVGGVPVEVGQISSTLPSYENFESAVASVDYNLSDRDSVRGRFILNRNGLIDTTGFPQTFFTTVPVNSYVATFSEFHTFTPSLTNEFRLGYNRLFQNYATGGANEKFPGLDQFPNITIYELNAGFGPDPNAPQFTVQNTYQATDNVSWTHGNHSFKFGFDGWKSISPSSFTQRSRGDYQWNNFSDYLFDTDPDVIAQRSLGNVNFYGDQFLLSWYGNDTWKLRPNLTLNLGLRYEYMTIPYSERLQSVNSAASVPGVISFNEPKPQNTNFMPRIGLAYSPGSSGKTSIRAGFGINYDIIYDNLGSLSLPPQFTTTVDVTGQGNSGFLAGGGIPPSAQVPSPTLANLRAETSAFIPDQKRPKSLQWNFGIQHVFAQDYTFETRYLGTRSTNLPMQVQLNAQSVVTSQNALPLYYSQPSQAALDGLTSNLDSLNAAFNNGGFILPSYANAGFTNPITAFMPVGNSIYHGWANQLTRRFNHGFQMLASYTWSHNIDDSTADVASTVLNPRRPQDFQNLKAERGSSALDHRQRLSFEMIYDVPYFKNRSWFLKNVAGNWEIAPVYSYQTGSLVTPQSGVDSNLNGDTASDRVFVNPNGTQSAGSDATALLNSQGQTVAYLATNPNAKYVFAPVGTLPNGGRNLLHLNPINNVDLTLLKRISITERYGLEFSARAFNLLNHAQYVGSFLNDVAPATNVTGSVQRNYLIPNSSTFLQPDQAFSSNPRTLQLSLKFTF